VAGIDDTVSQILAFALSALLAMQRGDVQQSREALARAHRLRGESTYATPWEALQARIVMARVHLAYGDVGGARAVLQDACEIRRRRPDIGVLAGQIEDIEARLRELPHAVAGSTSLTTAELRLLALLPTHLSYPDIAARLFVSTNTVKSQAMSIYRKLDASGRSGAVNRAKELGLLPG
jgi:LuxR family maltose regulon positive regulatory protein